MNMTKAIVTKTGNSYALRVPKKYITDNELKLGDVVDIENPLQKQRQALDALLEYGKKRGPLSDSEELVTWQRKERSDWGGRLKKQRA